MELNLIRIKLNNLKKNLNYLVLANQKKKDEKNEFELILIKTSIAKFIEEIVENAIKINTIILKKNNDYGKNYFETFIKLKNYLNIEEDFINEIAKTSSFRNNIVHNYDNYKTQDNLDKNIEAIIYLYKKYIKLIEIEIEFWQK